MSFLNGSKYEEYLDIMRAQRKMKGHPGLAQLSLRGVLAVLPIKDFPNL